jgi:heme/copper-type cytochrome/quinol oxidase subunit 2
MAAMKQNLTMDHAHPTGYDLLQAQAAATPAKKNSKKPSWLRTVLWMLSMVLLVNVVMAVLFYVLFHFGYIH